MSDARTYIKVHDGMPDHPKVAGLDDDNAAWLLIAMWAYCSRYLTDGRVPKAQAHRLTRNASKARCAKLVEAGLLEDDGADYICHDYTDHQRTAAEVEAWREQRRIAGRAGGLAKAKRAASESLGSSSSETASENVATEQCAETETPSVSGRKRPAKRATGVPDELPLTPSMRSWGAEHAPLVTDPLRETQQFLDWHRAKGSTFKDWTAAWRTWMGNAQKFAAERGPRQATGDAGLPESLRFGA